MKKFSKKSVLLFVSAMALCAFVMPSMASASSWGVVGSEHTLDSQDIGFINDGTSVSSMCTRSQFTADVVSTAVVEITTASFTGCTLTSASTGLCTATSTATNLPWTATAVSTSNIQIHGVNIDVFLENTPTGTECTAAGLTIKITGTITGATWTGNATHHIDFDPGIGGTGGLVSHSLLGNNQALTLTGTIRDTQNTLTATN